MGMDRVFHGVFHAKLCDLKHMTHMTHNAHKSSDPRKMTHAKRSPKL